MPWVRFDDGFPEHRKVAPLSDAAFRLHVQAVHWCARNLTDGVVGQEELSTVTRLRKPDKVVAELVRRGIWHQAGQVCDSHDCPASTGVGHGWIIHDYWDYQPSKNKVSRERRAKAERQKRWSSKRKGGVDASLDASTDASEDAAPYPPRPAPKEGGAGGRPAAPGDAGRSAGAAGRAHPSGSPGLAGEDQDQPPSCTWSDDGSGLTCAHCGLPPAHRIHASPPGGQP